MLHSSGKWGAVADFLRPDGYRDRIGEMRLERALSAAPMVLIEGAKGCGKTWLALSRSRSKMMLAEDPNALSAARTITREALLDGDRPKLVDEWQRAPEVWDAARGISDLDPGTGKFIFTGSYTRSDAITRHSGAGRLMRIRLRPMSLHELGEASAQVSISGLLAGETCAAAAPQIGARRLAELICRGGWPRHIGLATEACQDLLRAYLDETARIDLPTETGTSHDPVKVHRLLRSLARNVSTTASQASLARDTGGDTASLNHQTISRYLDALERLFVVDDLPAWSPHMMSGRPARQSPKRHLADPSLAAAALGVGPDRLARDMSALGLLFESLAVRDLRVYSDANDIAVLHHRDHRNGELDAVLEARDGSWIAAEVKLGGTERMLDEAAAKLLAVTARIDLSRRTPPSAHLIVTAFGAAAYQRLDGVVVAPLTALGP